MTTASKTMSTATAAYAVFALVRPRHLGKALTPSPLQQPDYDIVARTFGCRDLIVSGLALLAPSRAAREQAMVARICLDLSDAFLFSREAQTKQGKAKILAATTTWAALNGYAIVQDRRSS